MGLLLLAGITLGFIVLFDLNKIASIGSAVAITDVLWKRSRDRKAPSTPAAVDPAGAA